MSNFELRWAVPTHTSHDKPRLQFRTLYLAPVQGAMGQGMVWSEWHDVPTVPVLGFSSESMFHDLGQARKDAEDAKRFRTLLELCGHWQDGSDSVVKVFQDDATRSCIVKVDTKSYFGANFRAAFDEAAKDIAQ